MAFIVLPIQNNKEGRTSGELEDTRISVESILDYRPFKSDDGVKRTVFFFKKESGKRQLVSPVSTESVDKALSAIKLTNEEKLVG
tara:strand:- start:637 stop:891 length:255 start_codon:yes stop_codon:yes gene_type:complete